MTRSENRLSNVDKRNCRTKPPKFTKPALLSTMTVSFVGRKLRIKEIVQKIILKKN
jgi:hypothetical protein